MIGAIALPAAVAGVAWLVSWRLWKRHFLGEVPLASGLLLLLAPSAAWIGELRPIAGWQVWKATSLRVAAVALFAGNGLAIAAVGYFNTPPNDYYYWLRKPFATL